MYASLVGERGWGAKLHRSKDGGQNFDLIEPIYSYTYKTYTRTKKEEGKCGGENVHTTVYALLNPNNTQEILAACNHGGGGQSILKSSDSGKTWELVNWINFAIPEENYYSGGKVTHWSFHPKDNYYLVVSRGTNPGGRFLVERGPDMFRWKLSPKDKL